MSGSLKNNDSRFQAGDVVGRTSYALMIVFKLSSLCGIIDRQVQSTLCNVYTDTDCFRRHWFLLLSPSLRHAGLMNPINCSGFIGDLGIATTLTHGLIGPKVNRSATPNSRRIFYHRA